MDDDEHLFNLGVARCPDRVLPHPDLHIAFGGHRGDPRGDITTDLTCGIQGCVVQLNARGIEGSDHGATLWMGHPPGERATLNSSEVCYAPFS